MTSNNAKQAVRAIMADNPGMKYTEALRLHEAGMAFGPDAVSASVRGTIAPEPGTVEIGHTENDDPVRVRLSRGTFICGTTGSGKTVALAALARGAVNLGYEVTTINPVHPKEVDSCAGMSFGRIDTRAGLGHVASELETYAQSNSEKMRLLIVEDLPYLVIERAFDDSEVDDRRRIAESLLKIASGCPNTALALSSQNVDSRFSHLIRPLDTWIRVGATVTYSDLTIMGIDPSPSSPHVDRDDPMGTALISVSGRVTKMRIEKPRHSQ